MRDTKRYKLIQKIVLHDLTLLAHHSRYSGLLSVRGVDFVGLWPLRLPGDRRMTAAEIGINQDFFQQFKRF